MAEAHCFAPAPRPSPAVAPRWRRTIALVVGVGLLLGPACFAYFVLGVGRRGRAVESAGSAQVIARGDEARLFLDVFGLEDGPYLLRGPFELMRWQGDRFQPVPGWDRREYPAVPELPATPDYQEEPVLDRAAGRPGGTGGRRSRE